LFDSGGGEEIVLLGVGLQLQVATEFGHQQLAWGCAVRSEAKGPEGG